MSPAHQSTRTLAGHQGAHVGLGHAERRRIRTHGDDRLRQAVLPLAPADGGGVQARAVGNLALQQAEADADGGEAGQTHLHHQFRNKSRRDRGALRLQEADCGVEGGGVAPQGGHAPAGSGEPSAAEPPGVAVPVAHQTQMVSGGGIAGVGLSAVGQQEEQGPDQAGVSGHACGYGRNCVNCKSLFAGVPAVYSNVVSQQQFIDFVRARCEACGLSVLQLERATGDRVRDVLYRHNKPPLATLAPVTAKKT